MNLEACARAGCGDQVTRESIHARRLPDGSVQIIARDWVCANDDHVWWVMLKHGTGFERSPVALVKP